MRLLHITHPVMTAHVTGSGHPERPARLRAAAAGVASAGWELVEMEAPEVERELLYEVHARPYVLSIERFCRAGGGNLDPDTVAGRASWEAALRAAGAGPAAVAALRAGEADAAFLSVRPPGHHAETARAMGFCLFNNIAVAAAVLLQEGEKVAIIDWDVHHGNGTQDTFYREAGALYVSMHEFPAYPGSGWLEEIGYGAATGTTLNFPFPTGTSGDVYRHLLQSTVAPVLAAFDPDWMLISAGFDAHRRDPLAGLGLLESDYAVLGRTLAAAVPPGRTVFFLEGGYDLAAVEASVRSALRGAAGQDVEDEADRSPSPMAAWRIAQRAESDFRKLWKLV